MEVSCTMTAHLNRVAGAVVATALVASGCFVRRHTREPVCAIGAVRDRAHQGQGGVTANGGTVYVLQAGDFESLDPANNYRTNAEVVGRLIYRSLTFAADTPGEGPVEFNPTSPSRWVPPATAAGRGPTSCGGGLQIRRWSAHHGSGRQSTASCGPSIGAAFPLGGDVDAGPPRQRQNGFRRSLCHAGQGPWHRSKTTRRSHPRLPLHRPAGRRPIGSCRCRTTAPVPRGRDTGRSTVKPSGGLRAVQDRELRPWTHVARSGAQTRNWDPATDPQSARIP